MHDATPIPPAELELQRAFLRRLARQLVRGEAAAEDLVQDTFVRALERPPASAKALRAWLGRVARRLALNRVRGEQRALAREVHVARPESVASHDEALASLELQERLIAAVKALDEPYRTTVWLRFHEGLAPGAIAARQGTTKKTVESRLTRGLALLRGELDRRSGGDRTEWLGGVLLLARSRTVAPTTVGLAGGMLMKNLGVACALVLVLGVAWRLMPRATAPAAVEGGSVVSAPAAKLRRPTEVVSGPGPLGRSAVEPEPVHARQPRGALRIRVRWDDGTPAEGVGLLVFPVDDPLGERNVVRTRTDEAGLALVESIHAGGVRIEADRGAERTAEAVAGLEVEVTLDLPAGTDVEGTVKDASGARVAGAEILLVSARNGWLATRAVGTTDASGAFRIRAVGQDLAVSARAERYVPAFLYPLTEAYLHGEQREQALRLGLAAPPERSVRADLVLHWIDFALRGVVRDPMLRPVAGALVAVGRNGGQGYSLKGEPTRRRLGMPVVRTDENGRFEASGVEHAGMPVAVMAEGFPIQIAAFPGWSGSVSYGEIVLDVSASIAGIVRGPDGAPVAGALVRVAAVADRWALDVPFPLPAARSDVDGRFRLELVAPGKVPIRVEPPAGQTLGRDSRA